MTTTEEKLDILWAEFKRLEHAQLTMVEALSAQAKTISELSARIENLDKGKLRALRTQKDHVVTWLQDFREDQIILPGSDWQRLPSVAGIGCAAEFRTVLEELEAEGVVRPVPGGRKPRYLLVNNLAQPDTSAV